MKRISAFDFTTAIIITLLLTSAAKGETLGAQSDQAGSVATSQGPSAAAAQFDPKHYLKIEKGVVPPKPLETPNPGGSKNSGKPKGTVAVWVALNEQGTVDFARVTRGINPAFDQKALDSVKAWEFAPATKGGMPVPVQFKRLSELHPRLDVGAHAFAFFAKRWKRNDSARSPTCSSI